MGRRRLAAWAWVAGAWLTPGTSSGTRNHPAANTAPAPAPRRPAPAPAHVCTRSLVVRATEGAAGCWLDEAVTRAPGTLTWPCGDGPASARFGQSVFTGAVAGGRLTLGLQTRFHYGDGCEWSTTQSIRGAIGEPTLAYVYSEAPRAGQRGCASACRATATVTVR